MKPITRDDIARAADDLKEAFGWAVAGNHCGLKQQDAMLEAWAILTTLHEHGREMCVDTEGTDYLVLGQYNVPTTHWCRRVLVLNLEADDA